MIKINDIVQAIFDACINLLFPRRCPVCEDIAELAGKLICPSCISKLSPVRQPTCRKCGKELFSEQAEYCFDCSRHKRSFESGAALFNYNEAAKRSMAAIKYRNKREFLDFYAEVMVHRFSHILKNWKPDVLVPIPVHPSRRRRRGFNQAEELARRLSCLLDIPIETRLLVRRRKTAPQRELNPQQRLANLQQAFAVNPKCPVPRTVILIDDIYTTGSTMEACTRVLKAAGVQEVHFLVICIGGGR